MVEANRRTARILCGCCVIALAAVALAGCGGKTTPQAGGTTSLHGLSAADAKVLTYMNKITKLIDDSAAAAKGFVASLKDGTWLHESGPNQLAALTNMETFGQSLSKESFYGFPKAKAADLLQAEKGVLLTAAKASSSFLSQAVLSASDTIYISPQFLNEMRAKWEKKILAKQPPFETARAALAPVMSALDSKYGFKP